MDGFVELHVRSAFSFLRGQRFILLESAAADDVLDAAPGTVVRAEGDTLEIAAAPGMLRIISIQPEGKRAMAVREFLAGHHLSQGDVFTTHP